MIEAAPALFQMYAVFALIAVALVLYGTEKLPLEVTSFVIVCALIVLFQFFPVMGGDGRNLLPPVVILSGFANPALLTVLALLVLGEGLARTGVLDHVAVLVHRSAKGRSGMTVALALIMVMVVSGFLNNIPVVVLFIPIMQALAVKIDRPASRIMMSISYAAILGGMTTLIGSSTNLLVSSAMTEMGEPAFSFFDFTIPGLVVAGAGMVYVLLIAPYLLPDRKGGIDSSGGGGAKQFMAQMTIHPGSKFEGQKSAGGFFPSLKGVTVLSVQRGKERLLPPFDDEVLRIGDVVAIAATRDTLATLMREDPTVLHHESDAAFTGPGTPGPDWTRSSLTLAEVMVTPGSDMIGRTLEQVGFRYHHQCVVVGVERRARMGRERITATRLESGDILLVHGRQKDIEGLRGLPNVLLMEWSAESLPKPHHAKRATAIFLGTVAAAATGLVPTEVAALCGALLMILSGALSLEEAVFALDRKIVFLIAAALALGVAMHHTGGAAFLAERLLAILEGQSPAVVLSAFFLLVAVLANALSTKATAVLFTPIAIGIARKLDVPPEAFAVAVTFAANCSFASPVGYQTNIMVMSPGNYTFRDFIRVGVPLLIICWVAFSLFAPMWYGL